MVRTTVCTSCETPQPAGHGICTECGGVAIRPLRKAGWARLSATPLVRSRVRGDLWLKIEGANPTGTFKDRIMQVLVSEAASQGVPGAIVASSGNAAVAAALACRQAALPLLVVVPATIDQVKLRPLRLRQVAVISYGANTSEAYGLARHLAQRYGLAELASTYHSSGAELACRSIGHELFAQLPTPPAAIAAAISVGPVLVGTAHGLIEAGAPMPTLLGAQAAGCAPIARAFQQGDADVSPWRAQIETSATSIADPLTGYPQEGSYTLRKVRGSGGHVTAWTDGELHQFRERLASTDGLDVELSSAAALGAALTWSGPGPVVAVLTGAGWRETLLEPPRVPEVSAEDFAHTIGVRDLARDVARWESGSQSSRW